MATKDINLGRVRGDQGPQGPAGTNGTNGKDGAPGPANTVTGCVVKYQLSESGTQIPSGDWLSQPPAVKQGQYLWTQTTISYEYGNDVVTYSTAYQGVDGASADEKAIKELDDRLDVLEANWDSTIPNIQSAGINLLRGTRDFTDHKDGSTSGYPTDGFRFAGTISLDDFNGYKCFVSGSNAQGAYSSRSIISTEANQSYTWFVDVKFDDVSKISSNTQLFQPILQYTDNMGGVVPSGFETVSSVGLPIDSIKSGEWYRVIATRTGISPSREAFIATIYRNNSNVNTNISYKQPGIIKGDVDNPAWSASPFDVQKAGNYLDLGDMEQIPDNSDLNEYTKIGTYYIPNISSANTINNTPTKSGMKIINTSLNARNTMGLQVAIISQNSPNIYLRRYESDKDSFAEWKQISFI